MNTQEAIVAVRNKQRAVTDTSLHAEEDTAKSMTCRHHWRTIACDYETDVIECCHCGEQRLAKCNFDEEYA